jgi:FtsZ-interacting cell division protein ZipA
VRLIVASAQGDAVAWICFVTGLVILVLGVVIGLWTSFTRASRKADEAMAKLDEAKAKIGEAKAHIEVTTSAVVNSDLESFNAAAPNATEAVQAAGESTAEAGTALEQVQGIVGSLPENLRFAGLLVLVGTALMGVATIQFGETPIF